jgi:NADPH-dependent ferric siderophore reductase
MPDADALPEPRPLALTVDDRRRVTPLVTRVRLAGDDLAGFEHAPGQDVMLAIPLDGERTINRRYTIRRADADAGTLDLDIVVHGDAPGARWAADAPIGSSIAAVGPRGKVVPAPGAAWHLFVCDESGWAATASMVESLRPGHVALIAAEVAGPAEYQPLGATATLQLLWCERHGAVPGDPSALLDGVTALALPPGAGHAYLSAEFAVVRAVGARLAERGLTVEQISPKAYWRRGRANAEYGEPPRETA